MREPGERTGRERCEVAHPDRLARRVGEPRHHEVLEQVETRVALELGVDGRREHLDERGHARADMHHRAAGEIQHRHPAAQRPVEIAALAPNHVAQRKIHNRDPEQHEQHVSLELDPLRHRAADERGRDDGKHHLKQHERLLRHRSGVIRIRRAVHAMQHKICERISDKAIALRERHAVAKHHPER